MALVPAPPIKGLQPAIDRKKAQTPFVVDGKNFYMDIDGPVSGFGKVNILADVIAAPEYLQSFNVNGGAYLFTRTAILQHDEVSAQFVPVLTFTTFTLVRPWSTVVVGGLHYFAREEAGLVQFNPTTGQWRNITGASVPSGVVAITAVTGRLIILAAGIIAWSAIDDGEDLALSTITGAGRQSLSILGSGAALTVHKTPQGFLSFTTSGIIVSTVISGINPFHHKVLSTEHIALNGYCVVDIGGDTHIMLTKKGLYRTSGKLPELWQPLMSEYLHKVVLNDIDLELEAIIRLSHAPERLWFMVSISEHEISGTYTKAFVLNERTGTEWGVFNQSHAAFIDVEFALTGVHKGFHYGFVDASGQIYRFTGDAFDSLFATPVWNYELKQEVPDYPARYQNETIVFPCVLTSIGYDDSDYTYAGTYDTEAVWEESYDDAYLVVDAETATDDGVNVVFTVQTAMTGGIIIVQAAIVDLIKSSLDSYCTVGPFRITEEKSPYEISELTEVALGMLDTGIDEAYDDWMLDYQTDFTIDYLTASGFEDWGLAPVFQTEYDLSLLGTLDAYNVWNEQTTVPALTLEDGRFRAYSAHSIGRYHLVKISAEEINKSFALRTLEFNLNPAGVL